MSPTPGNQYSSVSDSQKLAGSIPLISANRWYDIGSKSRQQFYLIGQLLHRAWREQWIPHLSLHLPVVLRPSNRKHTPRHRRTSENQKTFVRHFVASGVLMQKLKKIPNIYSLFYVVKINRNYRMRRTEWIRSLIPESINKIRLMHIENNDTRLSLYLIYRNRLVSTNIEFHVRSMQSREWKTRGSYRTSGSVKLLQSWMILTAASSSSSTSCAISGNDATNVFLATSSWASIAASNNSKSPFNIQLLYHNQNLTFNGDVSSLRPPIWGIYQDWLPVSDGWISVVS